MEYVHACVQCKLDAAVGGKNEGKGMENQPKVVSTDRTQARSLKNQKGDGKASILFQVFPAGVVV